MNFIINNDDDPTSNKKCKLFVGNVPYQCTKNEFKKCFEHINGFVDADIIVKHNSTTSRGFGFVTFNTKKDADDALKINNVMFKERELRLSEYNFETKKQQFIKPSAIFIKNLSDKTTRDDIYNTFTKFGTVVKCFINTDFKTGKLKNSAVVELEDYVVMEHLINNIKTIELINGNVINMYNWNNKFSFENFSPKSKHNYYQTKEFHKTLNNIKRPITTLNTKSHFVSVNK